MVYIPHCHQLIPPLCHQKFLCGETDPRASQILPISQNEAPRALLAPPRVDGWVMIYLILYQLYYYCLLYAVPNIYIPIQITNSQYIICISYLYHFHIIHLHSYYYTMLSYHVMDSYRSQLAVLCPTYGT